MPPNTGKLAGMPNQPKATANGVIRISGTVIRLTLSGAFAAPALRGVVLPFSNPAMATAGTGDVLAGCIAGFMAQGLQPFDAAVCGAYLHGRAGEAWRSAHGDAGMLAGDLLPLLPDQICLLKNA